MYYSIDTIASLLLVLMDNPRLRFMVSAPLSLPTFIFNDTEEAGISGRNESDETRIPLLLPVVGGSFGIGMAISGREGDAEEDDEAAGRDDGMVG